MQDGGEQPQIPFTERPCSRAVWIYPAEAEKIYECLQMVCGHAFQLSAADGILLDTINCALIRHHRTVAQIAWFQFFLHPHIEQHCHRCIFGFCYEFLFFVILHCFAEQGFRFAFAFRTRKLPLYLSAAFIFDIEAVVPLFAFLSYRTFCHR